MGYLEDGGQPRLCTLPAEFISLGATVKMLYRVLLRLVNSVGAVNYAFAWESAGRSNANQLLLAASPRFPILQTNIFGE